MLLNEIKCKLFKKLLHPMKGKISKNLETILYRRNATFLQYLLSIYEISISKQTLKFFSISPRFVEARIFQRWKVVETVHSVSVLLPRFFFYTELDYSKLANSYFRDSLGYSKWKNRYISLLIRMHCFSRWKVGN